MKNKSPRFYQAEITAISTVSTAEQNVCGRCCHNIQSLAYSAKDTYDVVTDESHLSLDPEWKPLPLVLTFENVPLCVGCIYQAVIMGHEPQERTYEDAKAEKPPTKPAAPGQRNIYGQAGTNFHPDYVDYAEELIKWAVH